MTVYRVTLFRTDAQRGIYGEGKTMPAAFRQAKQRAGADFLAGRTAPDTAEALGPTFGPDKTEFFESEFATRPRRVKSMWSMRDNASNATLEIRRL